MSVECFWLEPTGETITSEDGSTTSPLYRREDTGEELTLADAPVGAMTDATWWHDVRVGEDGKCIIVKLPNGDMWMIDSQASNCTRPGEDHDCWCRHGEPPNLTVDKNPEPGRTTCEAGSGSIQSGDWHGFLRDGKLVT